MKPFYQEIKEQQFWDKWRWMKKEYFPWGSISMDVKFNARMVFSLKKANLFYKIFEN